jgi:ABC-2 type transport system permease protein
MFFVLIPAIIPTVIASYSFVGEKLNKSLEPLLATPTTDTELLAGKTLAIFIPSVLVTWISLLPAVIIVDLVTYPILGYYILPNMIWVLGVFLVAPLFCILSVLVNVIVSARVSDVRTSQQIGSIVILPVIAFFIAALAGVVVLNDLYMLIFGAIILAVDLVVFYISLRMFQREEILVKWK